MTAEDNTNLEAVRRTALILPTLDNTRDGLIKATGHLPCFLNTPADNNDDKLTFEVVLVSGKKSKAGFDFYFISLEATHDQQATKTNTITVYFRPSNPGQVVKPLSK
jgi:hypothetical protein